MLYKKAFTLAEIMIVLVVIGILTAILLPAGFQSAPDENIMKFKKANTTLYRVINELVSSDKYYKDGDLSTKPNGQIICGSFQNAGTPNCIGSENEITYFCKTFSDILSTKSVNCSTAKTGGNDTYTFVSIPSHTPNKSWQVTQERGKAIFDAKCSETAVTVGAEIVTNDNITYYQVNPSATFGVIWGNNYTRLFANSFDDNGFLDKYKIFCIDVDGINKGEDPFGYGIRVDGKIMPGERADTWLQKSIQDKE